MATPDSNIPDFFEEAVIKRLQVVYPELQQFKDEAEFIYAGLHPSYTILNRTVESLKQQVLDAYMHGKRKIFFDGVDESSIIVVLLLLHEVSEYITKLYPDIVCVLITGSAKSKLEYLNVCKNYNLTPTLEVLSYYFFESIAKDYYKHFISYFNFEYSLAPRKKIFTCLNRVLRHHRVLLLDKMLSKSLINENCYYSFYDTYVEDGGISSLYNYSTTTVQHLIDNIELVKTLRLNFDEDRRNPADLRTEDLYLYNDSYFSVIPETLYTTTTCIFFSEKTYKPIIMMQPFILVAVANSLSMLRERGYKTFHPYIDETYDTIIDDELRLEYIVNEVERLSKQSEAEWLLWLKNVKPIVEHNLEVLKSHTSFIQNKDLIGRLQSI